MCSPMDWTDCYHPTRGPVFLEGMALVRPGGKILLA